MLKMPRSLCNTITNCFIDSFKVLCSLLGVVQETLLGSRGKTPPMELNGFNFFYTNNWFHFSFYTFFLCVSGKQLAIQEILFCSQLKNTPNEMKICFRSFFETIDNWLPVFLFNFMYVLGIWKEGRNKWVKHHWWQTLHRLAYHITDFFFINLWRPPLVLKLIIRRKNHRPPPPKKKKWKIKKKSQTS